jgi:hypothetical protein
MEITPMDPRDFSSRRPRHEAQPAAECRLFLTPKSAPDEPISAQLADLSRHGLKAVTVQDLPENLVIQIDIELPEGRMKLTDSARVCWSHHQNEDQWAVGLSFDHELSWELMGELFLSGVLSREVASRLRLAPASTGN